MFLNILAEADKFLTIIISFLPSLLVSNVKIIKLMQEEADCHGYYNFE